MNDLKDEKEMLAIKVASAVEDFLVFTGRKHEPDITVNCVVSETLAGKRTVVLGSVGVEVEVKE